MSEVSCDAIRSIKHDICIQLGFNPDRPPIHLNTENVSELLGIRPATLNVWAVTGRYDLPYVKCGRLRRYSLHEVAAFIGRRTMSHVSQVKEIA